MSTQVRCQGGATPEQALGIAAADIEVAQDDGVQEGVSCLCVAHGTLSAISFARLHG
jgi:hypothetical protein